MPRIVHFEIYADDVDRASKFYTDLFGWEINKWDGPPQMDYRPGRPRHRRRHHWASP